MEVKISASPIDDADDAADKEKYGDFEKWEIDCGVDALIRAEEIKADPEKMKYIQPLLEEKLQKTQAAITSLSQLKKVAKAKINGEKY